MPDRDAIADPGFPAPRENPALVGHGEAEARLLRAWQSGRLPHAWLITGPPGIGKATLAYRFARFALAGGAPGAPAAEPPGLFGAAPEAGPEQDGLAIPSDHPVFQRVRSGSHPDLLVLQPGYDEERKRQREIILVDEIRAASRFMALTAGEGGWRVVIVDGAEQMNASAANALLKLLEEPPARALILLVSHAPGRLLPTIRSRCCRLALHRLSETDVAGLLHSALPALDASDAAALAGMAEGSIGRALALAEEEGLELYRDLIGLMAAMPNADPTALHAFAEHLARPATARRYRTAIDLLGWWLTRLARSAATGAPPPGLVPGERETAMRMIARAGLERWVEVWDKVSCLAAQADSLNLDRKQVVLGAFFAIEAALND